MGKKVHIYSTMPSDNVYAIYEPAKEGEQRRRIKKDVNGKPMKLLVKGGHGVANKHFVTPFGVHTEVDEADYDLLKNNAAFIRHEERGYIKVEKAKKDAEKAAKDMNDSDKSKPKTPKDFEEKNKPKTGPVDK